MVIASFCLIKFFNSHSSIFQLCWDGSSGLNQYEARENVFSQIHRQVTLGRLEPAASSQALHHCAPR